MDIRVRRVPYSPVDEMLVWQSSAVGVQFVTFAAVNAPRAHFLSHLRNRFLKTIELGEEFVQLAPADGDETWPSHDCFVRFVVVGSYVQALVRRWVVSTELRMLPFTACLARSGKVAPAFL